MKQKSDLRPVLVMGNGPSAKVINFDNFRDDRIATVGMNAAYRYWDRIDFRPTYYICMDSVLIKSHAGRIAELIREGRIERFFLRDEVREIYPEFEAHERVVWFDKVRAQKAPIFDTNMITTGSWAIRWMASLGHHFIATIGIDANYVEILAEAERLGADRDLRLELKSTPKFNPNYFFNDYQQAGDQYNIPNDPKYAQQTGQLVHIDALRRAKSDMEKLRLDVKVYDCSPISAHGVFPKISIDELIECTSYSLATSFYVSASKEELENNVRVAIQNCENLHLRRLTILLEGEVGDLYGMIPPGLQLALQKLETAGRIVFGKTDSRPDYLRLFQAAKGDGRKVCIVANSDILLDRSFLDALLPRYCVSRSPIIALTRWNTTRTGLFLQGGKSSPPWAEVPLDAMDFKDRNYLSFDTYVFDTRTRLPESLSEIKIGTFGCDTAIAAAFRVSGLAIINPCLRYRTIHLDERLRDYTAASGTEQMLANNAVVHRALIARLGVDSLLACSLNRLEELNPNSSCIGTPHPLGVWHSVFRVLGAVAWDVSLEPRPTVFLKLEIDLSKAEAEAEQWAKRILAAMQTNAFIELEVSGERTVSSYLEGFMKTPALATVRQGLLRYNWHSALMVDVVTDEQRAIHSDALLLLKTLLGLTVNAVSSPIVNTPVVPTVSSAPRGSTDKPVTRPVPSLKPAKNSALILNEENPSSPPRHPASGSAGNTATPFRNAECISPRILVIDCTPVGHASATGQLKQAYLSDWPGDRFLQVWQHGVGTAPLQVYRDLGRHATTGPGFLPNSGDLLSICRHFQPDVIYCRPTDSESLLTFAVEVASQLQKPIVLHIMDDWPERLRRQDEARYFRIVPLLWRLIEMSSVRLSISSAMSAEFGQRYGGDWVPLANGVDTATQPAKTWSGNSTREKKPFVIRYMGGLAPDMSLESVSDVASAVRELALHHDIRLEICTMPWYLEEARARFDSNPAVRISGLLPQDQYLQSLCEVDALLIAYNFDPLSQTYTKLSLANKLPECLGSGVPVLAYGPAKTATIATLASAQCALVVTNQDRAQLRQSVLKLVLNPGYAKQIGTAGRAWATEHLSLALAKQSFLKAIAAASEGGLVLPSLPARYCSVPESLFVWSDPRPGAPASESGWSISCATRAQRGESIEAVIWLEVRALPAALVRARIIGCDDKKADEWKSLSRESDGILAVGIPLTVKGSFTVEVGCEGAAMEVNSVTAVRIRPRHEITSHDLPSLLQGANSLFRSGDFAAALVQYSTIHAFTPRRSCSQNVLRSVARLFCDKCEHKGTT